jgi:hypothetical protein
MRRSKTGLLTAFVIGALVVSGPQIAIAAFDAVNSDKVDGKHAVGAGATLAGRAGKLVATNAEGRLPNNIIAKAPDANLLDGQNADAFQQRVSGTCTPGSAATAVGSDGSLTCAADAVDGGDAETVDGLSSAAFARSVGSQTVAVPADGTATENASALRAALAAITDNTSDKRYVLVLGAGTYDLGDTMLTLKPFVSVTGAGRNATFLTSAAVVTNPNGAITLANGVELSRLSITVSHATTAARTAVGAPTGVTSRLTDVSLTYTAPAGFSLIATGANVEITDSRIFSDLSGTGTTHTVFAYNGSTVHVQGSDVEVAAPSSTNVTAAAAQGTGSVLEVVDSRIRSTGRLVHTFTATAQLRVANSELDGVTTGVPAAVTCFNNFDELFAAVACTP